MNMLKKIHMATISRHTQVALIYQILIYKGLYMSWDLLKKYAVTAMVVFSSFSFAAQEEQVVIDNIKAEMNSHGFLVSAVSPFAVEGFYEILTDRGIYYISSDAKYLLVGDVYDLDNQINLSKQKRMQVSRDKVTANIDKLKSFEKDMIVYKAPQEKHVITVFTDPSCTYCQKLHAEMADYHKQGITVRYLAFPRGGINTSTYHSMVSIWCADDPKLAMDSVKAGRPIAAKSCENTVKEQYELGELLGISGTPAIILEDGSLKPGYLPADSLIQLLEAK